MEIIWILKQQRLSRKTWERENISDIVELVNDVGFTYFYFIST